MRTLRQELQCLVCCSQRSNSACLSSKVGPGSPGVGPPPPRLSSHRRNSSTILHQRISLSSVLGFEGFEEAQPLIFFAISSLFPFASPAPLCLNCLNNPSDTSVFGVIRVKKCGQWHTRTEYCFLHAAESYCYCHRYIQRR